MKFSDYKHFMIVSTGTALMLQMDSHFAFSMPEPVEESPYPNAELYMHGVMIHDVPKTEDYPNGEMYIAVYVDSKLPFTNTNKD